MPPVPLPSHPLSLDPSTLPFPTTQDRTLSVPAPQTDPEAWRLIVGEDSHGQHKWRMREEGRGDKERQSVEDRYWLGLETVGRGAWRR